MHQHTEKIKLLCKVLRNKHSEAIYGYLYRRPTYINVINLSSVLSIHQSSVSLTLNQMFKLGILKKQEKGVEVLYMIDKEKSQNLEAALGALTRMICTATNS